MPQEEPEAGASSDGKACGTPLFRREAKVMPRHVEQLAQSEPEASIRNRDHGKDDSSCRVTSVALHPTRPT